MCGPVGLGWVAEGWSGYPPRCNAGGTNSDAGGIGIGDWAQLRSQYPAHAPSGVSTRVNCPIAIGSVEPGTKIRMA